MNSQTSGKENTLKKGPELQVSDEVKQGKRKGGSSDIIGRI